MVRCVATLDTLGSLAITSMEGDNRGECVRPEFVPRTADEPVLELRDSRHPCILTTFNHGSFIANDIFLGGSSCCASPRFSS